MNIQAARLNPLCIKALYDAQLNRNINDDISAKTIAEYLIVYPEKVFYNTDDPYLILRKQWNFIEMLKKQHTQLLNQFSVLLYESFPFLTIYCKNGVPNCLFQLILKYPSAQRIARTRESSLCKIPYISHKRAQSLISNATQSIR